MEVDRIEVLKEVFAQNVQAASLGFKRQHQKRVGKEDISLVNNYSQMNRSV